MDTSDIDLGRRISQAFETRDHWRDQRDAGRPGAAAVLDLACTRLANLLREEHAMRLAALDAFRAPAS